MRGVTVPNNSQPPVQTIELKARRDIFLSFTATFIFMSLLIRGYRVGNICKCQHFYLLCGDSVQFWKPLRKLLFNGFCDGSMLRKEG